MKGRIRQLMMIQFGSLFSTHSLSNATELEETEIFIIIRVYCCQSIFSCVTDQKKVINELLLLVTNH